ncbi:PPC domain-containing protein [Horticoccus sp. 23ND18S-11]
MAAMRGAGIGMCFRNGCRGGLIAGLSLATAAFAVTPALTTVTPTGGQRGTSVEVTLRGDRLADMQDMFFYQEGITLQRVVEATDKQVKAVFAIAPDCPLGEHLLRVRTAGGISPLRLFFVGPFAAVDEKEPNNTRDKAQPVSLNTTVQGAMAGEDVDTFVVEAKAGQRLSLEIEGARLGRTMFDPHLAIQDETGRVVAASDDTPLLGHDGFVSVVVPAAGRYFVQVHDMAYAGNGHVYRLHVGDFSRPAIALPPGGQAGTKLEARFIGDPAGDVVQAVRLPAAPHPKFGYTPEGAGATTSPNWFRASAFPNADVATTSPTAATAPVVGTAVPFAFNGVLAQKGEPAFFRFNAKQGQNLEVQVFARRLGSPLDSVLTVLSPKGATLGNNDDASGNPDSSLRVKIAETGVHAVKIADQLGRGSPLYVYRVEITEVSPAITLSIPDTARYDNETRKSIVVPRGNRFAVLMNLNRDASNSELQLAFDGLPEGVSAVSDRVPGSLSAVPVVFEAAADAPIAGRLLTPVATAVDPATAPHLTSRFRHTVEWVRIQNDTVYTRSEVNRIAAAVVEELPFKVRVVEPRVPLVQGGEMSLRLVAERAEGFTDPITVKMLWNPPGVTSPPDLVIPKNETTVEYKLNANAKAEARTSKIALIASATVKGGLAHVSTQLAALEVAPAFLFGKIALTKVERGQRVKLVCALEQKVAFEGPAVARLVGLPNGTTAEPVEITKDSAEAVFDVVTTEKSPLGNHKSVFCSVVVKKNEEPITHVIATGSVLRIDPPRGKPVAVAEGVKP